MLNKAFERFPSTQGLIMHSDQGWQYQHAFYRNELQKHGIIQSMSRKGNCYDNCIMETFFGRLKNEMFYGFEKDYPSFEAFSKAIADYIDYYNNSRIQAKIRTTSKLVVCTDPRRVITGRAPKGALKSLTPHYHYRPPLKRPVFMPSYSCYP